MRNKILVVLLVAIVFAGCSEYGIEEVKDPKDYMVTNINPSQDELAMLSFDYTMNGQLPNGRSVATAFGEVDLDEALKVENFLDGVIRYTF